MATKRNGLVLGITLPVKTVEKLDEYCLEKSLKRSTAIGLLLQQGLDANKMLSSFNDFVDLAKREKLQKEALKAVNVDEVKP